MRRCVSLDNILYCSNLFIASTQFKSHECSISSRLFQHTINSNEQEKVTQQHSLISGALRSLVRWVSELIQTSTSLYFLREIDIQQTIWRPLNGAFWNLAS